MPTIYILRLQQGKFYVGRTRDRISEPKRLLAHSKGQGSAWTRKYGPISEVMSVQHDCDALDELKMTLKMMDTYGINNVRGAQYVSDPLSQQQLSSIYESLANANDSCLRCYSPGHFVRNCTATHDIYGTPLSTPRRSDDDGGDDGNSTGFTCCFPRRRVRVKRTREPVQTQTQVQAIPAQQIWTFYRDRSRDVCYKCKQVGHWAFECQQKKTADICVY